MERRRPGRGAGGPRCAAAGVRPRPGSPGRSGPFAGKRIILRRVAPAAWTRSRRAPAGAATGGCCIPRPPALPTRASGSPPSCAACTRAPARSSAGAGARRFACRTGARWTLARLPRRPGLRRGRLVAASPAGRKTTPRSVRGSSAACSRRGGPKPSRCSRVRSRTRPARRFRGRARARRVRHRVEPRPLSAAARAAARPTSDRRGWAADEIARRDGATGSAAVRQERGVRRRSPRTSAAACRGGWARAGRITAPPPSGGSRRSA